MFKTIIWATDGSEAAERALPIALDLTAQGNGMLFVVHADERFGGRASGVPVIADEDDVEAELAAKVKELVESGVNASFHVVRGTGRDPADLIADVAKEGWADLIVVGTRITAALPECCTGVSRSASYTSPRVQSLPFRREPSFRGKSARRSAAADFTYRRYHLGYPDFRGEKLRKPLVGDATGSPEHPRGNRDP